MSDKIIPFSKKPDGPEDFLVGPFVGEYRVVVDGRKIPNLTGHREDDGKVWLTLDHRMTFYFNSDEDAYQAASIAANAMAIGAGYSHAGAESKEMPFAPRMSCIGSVSTSEDQK